MPIQYMKWGFCIDLKSVPQIKFKQWDLARSIS